MGQAANRNGNDQTIFIVFHKKKIWVNGLGKK